MTWLAVLALHAIVVLLIGVAMRLPGHRTPIEDRAPAVAWVRPEPPLLPPAAAQSAVPPRSAPPPARAPARRASPIAGPARAEPESAAITPPQPVAAASAPPAASAPVERLLDTEATRTAIRAIGREPLLSERAAAGERLSGAEKFAERVQQAGKGDCLKGEYAFAGGGLLSVPVFIAAQALGHCAK